MSTAETIKQEIAEEQKEIIRDAILTAVAFVGLVGGILLTWYEASSWLTLSVFALTYLAGGLPAAKEAFTSLLQKSLNIDLLMVLAAVAAALVGEVRDGAILLFLFSLAGTLEAYAMGSTKRAVAALLSLHPDTARRKNADGQMIVVPVEELKIGDVVVVRPGERVPIDGELLSLGGAVDQSPITGESVPVDKATGDALFAGSVNQNTVLELKVTATASNSTLARMIKLVTEAQEKRSPSESFSDWFGERYTIVVLVGSLLALVGFLVVGMETSLALYKAATLLVVASPCAIVISVPAAILSALTASAKRGALFKGGQALELFGGVEIVAFDKTGTLTEGKMSVVDVYTNQLPIEKLLALASGLEQNSEHPIASSICEYAEVKNVLAEKIANVQSIPGRGLFGNINESKVWAGNRVFMEDNGAKPDSLLEEKIKYYERSGKTVVIIGQDKTVLGVIAVADTLRDSAKSMIEALRQSGVKRIVMLSGDGQKVAESIGAELGLNPADVFGGLLPEDKVNKIAELRKSGVTAFVGDGVNDAGALATADIGLAMGVAGTDVAIEAADVALMSNDLRQIVTAHEIAKKANTIIKQNLVFAIGILALMVVVTVFFYLPLPLGVVGHEGGTLLVVANGLRLLWLYR